VEQIIERLHLLRKNPLSSATSATTVKTLDLAEKVIHHKKRRFGLFSMA
jgi:hypothetical protein